jgi:hypothetical protein
VKLSLNRCWLTPRATMGKLLIDDVFECFTCEDRYRAPPEPKVPHETCIPVGQYEVLITPSPRFKVMMPLLVDVPGFVGVRIHPGNTVLDTDGCILVGRERNGERVEQSRVAYEALFSKLAAAELKGERVTIAVSLTPHEGEPPCPTK